jgi:hypothetical protein
VGATGSVRFLVIGGQKCATTTLFHHLASHPQVYMPPQKEVNFFAKPERYARGLDWYLASHFADAPDDAICGEASPLYLAFGSAAARIRASLPEAKLIALLRNPIERAWSHYRMAVRRGLEARDFATALREEQAQAPPGPDPADPERDYLAFGTYGVSLAAYLERFPRRQIHVEFTEELARDPAGVMRRITVFVGADPAFAYPELGRVYHAGGRGRLPRPLARAVKGAIKRLHPLIGTRRARGAAFWFETEASVRKTADPGPSPSERELLIDFYARDVARLEALLGMPVPWQEFRAGPQAAEGRAQ